MADQSVTGSCQQCDRTYALRVPEPGSDDLALDRVTALFGWCAECGRLVGRACCWGSDGRCARCAAAQATSVDTVGGFAALGAARAAVRLLDGTAARFSAVEDAVSAAAVAGATPPADSPAWRRSWLAAGTLRARIDGSREAAASLLRLIPPDEAERAEELHDELLAVDTFLEARWRGITQAMDEAGTRLAKQTPKPRRRVLSAVGARPQPRAVVTAGRPPTPSAAPAAVAVAMPVAIRAPDRAVIRVGAPAPAAARPATVASTTRSPQRAPAAPAAPAASAAPASVPQRAHWVGQPSARVEPRLVVPLGPAVSPVVTPSGSDARERRSGRAGRLLVAVVALAMAAAIIAVGRQPDAAADGSSDLAGIADPAATTPAADSAQSPSPSPLSVGTPDLPSTVITVDEHPVGPLDLDELPVTRVLGEPEVAAFPSAFDRSLRLGGPAAGVCLPSSAEGSALTLDLHLSELGTAAGRLAVSFGNRTALTLDVASLATLDPSAWYRLRVTALNGDGRATISTLADERLMHDIELEGGASDAPATAGEVCLHAELQATGASVLVDNLRTDG